jgi:hypothetical protein
MMLVERQTEIEEDNKIYQLGFNHKTNQKEIQVYIILFLFTNYKYFKRQYLPNSPIPAYRVAHHT